jgi:dTDP-4-amino-4,6-dideoxygalactose transaminase
MDVIEHSKPTLGGEEEEAVLDVLRSGYISEGRITEEFEKSLSAFLNVSDTVCLPSGYLGLFLAIRVLDGEGAKVFMPTFVCREVFDAVKLAGAEPVLCDIGEDFNLSADDVCRRMDRLPKRDKKITVLPHMFGLAADIESHLELGIPVIEDCAQSLGSHYGEKMTGTLGDVGVFSFEATKVIATGQGGAVTSSRSDMAGKLRNLKHDMILREAPRYSFYFTDLQSAIGIAQMKRLAGFIESRKDIAKGYFQSFKALPVALPETYADREHIFYRFMVGSEKLSPRDVMEASLRAGVKIKQVVPLLHREIGLDENEFPVAESVLREWVSVPIYPSLDEPGMQRVIATIEEIYS